MQKFPLDSGTLSLNMAGRMCVGGLAGLVATIVTHPMDVVRARLTVQDSSSKVYRGRDMCIYIYEYYGESQVIIVRTKRASHYVNRMLTLNVLS